MASAQLLFGIIALQNNFITREQLISAFDAWARDKRQTLGEILVAQGALAAESRQVLDSLVSLFLQKHGGDAEKSLAALSPAHQIGADLARIEDQDLLASLGHVGRDAPGSVDRTLTFPVAPADARGRFRILRPHALGGLGQVSVALDQELHREVALKEIRPQHADNPVSRERFVLEAEVTGGLEHPGIVPVYALGQDAQGRPFYAMRFVKGDSLKLAIEQYHDPQSSLRNSPGARQLALRRLLQRFIDVCNAIEYAHSRGVLHRDLKPGNIMVGQYGETLVVDWGLAKVVGRSEPASDEHTLRPTSVLSSSGHTVSGMAVGTPAYMSPEQALGKLDDLGPATDVYGLGATLYHLLCGRPPYGQDELAESLVRITRGEFPRPRAIVPQIPRALEAICLKAMATRPADRYSSARQLAEDLEHWLADEPVIAAPDRPVERLGRFGRRHKGLLRASAAALVLVAAISILAAFLIDQQRREKSQIAQANAELAERTARFAESERTARHLADQRAVQLQMALARNHFDQGVHEYEGGRPVTALKWLRRALALAPPGDPLIPAYRRVLVDRCLGRDRQLLPPLWHEGAVRSAAFSPDGTRVLTGSGDNTARLWDAQTGAPLGQPMRHEGPVEAGAFSPDGTRVLTVSVDNTARLWDAAMPDLAGIPTTTLERVLESWTGLRAQEDGTVRELGLDELQAIRAHLGIGDLLARFTADRMARCAPAFYALTASDAERNHHWFAAVFHLRKLQDLQPGSEAIAARLAFCAAMARRDDEAALGAFERWTVVTGQGGADSLNRLAREWATSIHPRRRAGNLAVVAARKACELTEWRDWRFLDTLAAAHAETGNFEEAVKWQTTAIDLAPRDSVAQKRQQMASRLELYRSGMPYRE